MCLSFCFCAAEDPHSQPAEIAQEHLETESIGNGRDASGEGLCKNIQPTQKIIDGPRHKTNLDMHQGEEHRPKGLRVK